nr:hypothetical protein pPsy0462b_00061 [Pseudomonas syringae]
MRTVASYTHILTEVAQPTTVSVLKVSRKAVPMQPKQDRSPATPPVRAPLVSLLMAALRVCNMVYIRYLLRSRRGRKLESP